MFIFFVRRLIHIMVALFFIILLVNSAFAMTVHVTSDNCPVSNAKVVLWQAVPEGAPKKLEEAITGADGKVQLGRYSATDERHLYLISNAGTVKGNDVPMLQLLAVLPKKIFKNVEVNELTTIGSVWPNAQLFDVQKGLTGTANGLIIGAAQVGNLTNIAEGGFGKTIINASNLTYSETVARMNTLGALVSLCGASEGKGLCDDFLSINNAGNTLEALVRIARIPYHKPDAYFSLFTKAFQYLEGEGRRITSFLPYLSYVPEDFSLMVRFNGGGIYSPGRMMFDVNANLWSGQNWMPGSQSGLYTAIGGGVVRLAPDGTPISPNIIGYNGQGLDGMGWGTTVSMNKVWVATFNKKIGVYDLEGNSLGPASVDGTIGMLQGVATAPNGDVWVCDNQLDQLIRFPKGDHSKGELIKVKGLRGPFAVVVDSHNVVWVTNAASATVTRFPAEVPENVMQIQVGISPRGLAVDTLGNVWVSANLSPGFPLPVVPKGTGIIEEFRISIENILAHQDKIPITGNITLIDPQGKVLKSNLLNGKIYGGWGISIAGDNTVFASNFMGTGFMHVCGVLKENCPEGIQTGELIHAYKSGLLQEVTDTMIDDAGNVWVANNWDVIDALIEKDPDRRMSTMGGGNGIVVIYGIAKPVQNPLIGVVRPAR